VVGWLVGKGKVIDTVEDLIAFSFSWGGVGCRPIYNIGGLDRVREHTSWQVAARETFRPQVTKDRQFINIMLSTPSLKPLEAQTRKCLS